MGRKTATSGFIPVEVDINVLENEPTFIQVRNAGAFTPEEQGFWNGMALVTNINNMLLADTNTDSAKNNFLSLEPEMQKALLQLNPEAEYAKADESFLKRLWHLSPPYAAYRLYQEPLRTLATVAEPYMKLLYETEVTLKRLATAPIELIRDAELEARGFGGGEKNPLARVTNPAYWKSKSGAGWYKSWNQEGIDELDKYYNRATGVLMRGLIDQKPYTDIFTEYGTVDEDLANIWQKIGTPEFDIIYNRYYRHKMMGPGNVIVDWAQRFAPLKENPTTTDTLREVLAAAIVGIPGVGRNLTRNEFGEFVTEKMFKPGEYGDPAFGLDMVLGFFLDPLTYYTFGGSKGIALMAGAKSAKELQAAVDAVGTSKTLEELFKDPRFVAKHKSFIEDVNAYRNAKTPQEAIQARVKIKLNHPEYDNDAMIDRFMQTTVKKEGKEVPITDMDTFYTDLLTGKNVNSLINGTVDDTTFFREGSIALQTRTRLMRDGIRHLFLRIFHGLDKNLVLGKNISPKAMLNIDENTTWEQLEKALLTRPEFDENAQYDLVKKLAKPRNYALKDINRVFGELFTRHPGEGVQIFWTDSKVNETLGNLRRYARLITGDALRAEFITQLYRMSTKGDRINLLANLEKLWLKENGADLTAAGRELLENILNSRYMLTELPSISQDYIRDIPDFLAKSKVLQDIPPLPPGPSALMHASDGVTLLPFDQILGQIWGSLGGLPAIKMPKFKYGQTSIKNIVKKILYMPWVGFTYSAVARTVQRAYVGLLLIPKMAQKNATDEAFVQMNVSTPALLADLATGKGRELSNLSLAISGNNIFQGPIKGYLLNKVGKNPISFMSAKEREELTSMHMKMIEFKDPKTGKMVTQKELVSAEEFFGRPPEQILVLNAMQKYLTKFNDMQKADIYDLYTLGGDDFSEAMIASTIGVTYGNPITLGEKLAKELYGKSPLTEAIENAGYKVLSRPYLDIFNKLKGSDRVLAHYSYWWKLFSANEKHGVNLPENFFWANALKTEDDLKRFIDDSMKDFGWKDNPTPKQIEHAIRVNDEFGQISGLRKAGLSEMEISRIIIKNAALEMRYIFHGGTEYNNELFSLIKEKRNKAIDKTSKMQKAADKRMLQREDAGIHNVISFEEMERRKKYFNKATQYSTIAGTITRAEFEEATKGFILKGPIKTDIGFADIKFYDRTVYDGPFRQWGQELWKWMDRQQNDFLRSDLYFLKYLEERDKLRGIEKLHREHLIASGATPENAIVQAKAVAMNDARNNAINIILKYVDNPGLRSQLAYNMRVTGRFIRAAEDFARRTIRWMIRHPASIPYRIGHLGYATDGMGITYKDEDGNIYILIPNDGIFWKEIAPAITMLLTAPHYSIPVLGKIGLDTVLGKSLKDNPHWGFFKQADWNQYAMKISLLNPSYSKGAGAYTLLGPTMAVPVIPMRQILVGAGTTFESPLLYNIGLSLDNILLGDVSDDVDIWRATLPPALINWGKFINNLYLEKEGEGYKDNLGAISSYQAIGFMQYMDTKKPEDFLDANGEFNPLAAEKFLKEWRIQVANVLAQKAGFNSVSGAPLGLGSPDIPKYLRKNGVITFTQEYGDILRAVLDFNQKNGFPIADPYAFAVSYHAADRPGKLIFQVPKNTRESNIAINYTKETLLWAIKNKEFVTSYPTASWIFAPNIGKYNPRVINYLEAADLISPKENPFDWNNRLLKDYVLRTSVTKEMYKYYQYDKEVERLFNNPNNPNRNLVGYRTAIKAAAKTEQEALLYSNPLFRHVFENRPFQTEAEIETPFTELKFIVSTDSYPENVTQVTKDLLKMMVRSTSELLIATKSNTVKGQYLGDTELRLQVNEMFEKYKDIARQNPILGEAWTAIIRPLLDKTYNPPLKIVRKPGD